MRTTLVLGPLLAASLGAAGCVQPVAWRVPVAPPKAWPGAQECVRTCEFYSDRARAECLSKCPGSEQVAKCPTPREPPAIAVCDAGSQESSAAVPVVLGGLLLVLLVAVTIVSNPDACPGC